MSMDFKEQVRATVNIVKVVGEYVRLRKAGTRWVGLCPFHQEKSPSFGVNEGMQVYKCFGCGAGGDVFKFVMEIEGVGFFEALKSLAERNGLQMPKRREFSDPATERRGAIFEMHEVAAQQFAGLLKSDAGREARAYLAKRGVAEAMIEHFGLGYSDRAGQTLLRALEQKGYAKDAIEASGLIGKTDGGRQYDRFRNRLMFPIHNETGKIIGFGGRSLGDDEPKYLNSPGTEIYDKSAVLYNLNRAKAPARKAEFSILVEGYMDVIGVYAAGIHNVVASCGTALTAGQVRMLKRHADRIVANFDPDAAGANATEKSIQILLEEGFHVKVLSLAGGLDPDEYIKERGADDYRAALGKADSYFHWLAQRARARFDMGNAEGRMEAVKTVLLPAVLRIPDRIERLAVASELARFLGVDESSMRDMLKGQDAGGRKAPVSSAAKRMEEAATKVSDTERTLLRVCFESEEMRRHVLGVLGEHPVLERLPVGNIFRAMMQIQEAGAVFGYAEVETRLKEDDRALLAQLFLSDKTTVSLNEAEVSLEQVNACLGALEQVWRKGELQEYNRQIKDAERAGRFEDAFRLMEERRRLEQRRWKLSGDDLAGNGR